MTDEPSESLFGYLAARFVSQRENLATEGLAWVLKRSAAAEQALREALSQVVEGTLAEPLVWSTQDAGPAGTPDLTGREGAHPRVLVEAKFDAALTAHQPVGYLGLLSDGDLLTFLVPSKRVAVLWPEVCRLADALPAPVSRHPAVRLPTGVTLAMFTWREVMDALLAATALDQSARISLQQLDGLVQKVEAEVFQPLAEEELTANSARRIVDCGRIIQTLAERLQEPGPSGVAIADKPDSEPGAGRAGGGTICDCAVGSASCIGRLIDGMTSPRLRSG